MEIHVDRDRCTGLGLCESIAPEFFRIAADGSMQVLGDPQADDSGQRDLSEAVVACPTQALSLHD